MSYIASSGFHVSPLTAAEAKQLLLVASDDKRRISDLSGEETKSVELIAAQLGGYPLAIAQIAGAMARRKITFQEAWELYQTNDRNLSEPSRHLTQYHRTVEEVFTVSMAALSGEATALLHLVALLCSPDHFTQNFLKIDGAASE